MVFFLYANEKILLQTLLTFNITTEIRSLPTFPIKGQTVNISGLWVTSSFYHIFFFILLLKNLLWFSIDHEKHRQLNQSLKSIVDLAVICFSKLSLVFSPFCTPCSSPIKHFKFDKEAPHLYLQAILCDKPTYGTDFPLCCCNPTISLTDSIQMLSLPGSLPCVPSQTSPLLNSLHFVPLLTLITFFLGCRLFVYFLIWSLNCKQMSSKGRQSILIIFFPPQCSVGKDGQCPINIYWIIRKRMTLKQKKANTFWGTVQFFHKLCKICL